MTLVIVVSLLITKVIINSNNSSLDSLTIKREAKMKKWINYELFNWQLLIFELLLSRRTLLSPKLYNG